jgi:branched-chain amino acid transport system ATP-binding protein
MSDNVLLRVENVSLSFGGVKALNEVTLEVKRGEILSIIGPNGAGKTSLLNCISKFYYPEKGKIYFEEKDITRLPMHSMTQIGIARTFQKSELYLTMTTLDNLMTARHTLMKHRAPSFGIHFNPTFKEEIYHRIFVDKILQSLGMVAIKHIAVSSLPFGVRKKIDLARALVQQPKLLLLDEPVAGMNFDEKKDIVNHILKINREQGITILLV